MRVSRWRERERELYIICYLCLLQEEGKQLELLVVKDMPWWWPPRATIVAGLIWVGGVLLTIVAEAVAMYRFPKGNGWPPTVPIII